MDELTEDEWKSGWTDGWIDGEMKACMDGGINLLVSVLVLSFPLTQFYTFHSFLPFYNVLSISPTLYE